MRGLIITAMSALAISGCSEETAPAAQPQQQAADLTPGQYQASWTVSALRSTDRTTPATELAQSATGTSSGCVAADGKIDPALFAEAGDECTPSSSYIRNGRISIQLSCKRPGDSGQVMQSVNARSTGDAFDGEVSTSTYLSAPGDYAMTRTFTGKRVGECPPVAEGEPA